MSSAALPGKVGLIRLAIIVGSVLLLEVLCRTGVISNFTLIPPSEMLVVLWGLLSSGWMNEHMAKTFQNVGASFVLSVVFGFLAGVAIHAIPRLRRVMDPLLASYYSVPFFVFYPLFIVIFGVNDWPLIFIGFLFASVAMVINTLNGLDRIPRVFWRVAKVHRLDRWQTIRMIIMPAATPYLFTGVKFALAYSFIGVLAGEFILSSSGLGYSIAYAYNNFDNRTMYALVLFVLLLVGLINGVLHMWEQRLLDRRRRA